MFYEVLDNKPKEKMLSVYTWTNIHMLPKCKRTLNALETREKIGNIAFLVRWVLELMEDIAQMPTAFPACDVEQEIKQNYRDLGLGILQLLHCKMTWYTRHLDLL